MSTACRNGSTPSASRTMKGPWTWPGHPKPVGSRVRRPRLSMACRPPSRICSGSPAASSAMAAWARTPSPVRRMRQVSPGCARGAPAMTCGGSSGGAAVAAATGAGVLHLGTDGGGSIRIPASFCGIVGLKPTFGTVPAYPASAFGTVAHIGPMARSVDDAAAMLRAMSGRDLRDWAQGWMHAAPQPLHDGELAKARIGYWTTPPSGALCPEVGAAVEFAVSQLRAAGARVERVDLPGKDLHRMFQAHWFASAAHRLAGISAAEQSGMDAGLRQVASAGARLSAPDLVAQQIGRAHFAAAMDRLLTEFDFLVSPAASILPFSAGLEVPQGSGLSRWTEWAGFSYPINLSQQPAC